MGCDSNGNLISELLRCFLICFLCPVARVPIGLCLFTWRNKVTLLDQDACCGILLLFLLTLCFLMSLSCGGDNEGQPQVQQERKTAPHPMFFYCQKVTNPSFLFLLLHSPVLLARLFMRGINLPCLFLLLNDRLRNGKSESTFLLGGIV